jgi:two-component system, chemotaxis family, protein-glutamate methylesterase/glutaminase
VPQLDVIVIGASAGGVGSLQRVAERLPPALPASVFVTLHLPEGVRSVLPRILERAGPLPAGHAQNGQTIEPGRIYIAPPGYHMTLERDRVRVSRGAREHGLRPAIDPLFRSAALAFGPRVIGVVLSGQLDDGTVGLAEIKHAGGIAVVQDPEETAFPSMPRSAIAHVNVDYVLPADEIGPMLEHLVRTEQTADRETGLREAQVRSELDVLTNHQDEREKPGQPSPFACPDCGGVLWELAEGELLRFRCRVGHAFTADSLIAAEAQTIEESLWTALRAIEEQLAVKKRLAERMARQGRAAAGDQLLARARELEHHGQQIRSLLLSGVGASGD